MKQSLRAATALAAFVRRGAAVPYRLLQRDRVQIALGSQRIGLARYRQGLNSGLVYSDVVPLERNDHANPWQAAVDALPGILDRAGNGRPAVTVVVANEFVRYALLPWSAAIRREAEWLAYARHRYGTIHGAVTEGWFIRIAPAAHNLPRLAAAIDSALLGALRDAVYPYGPLVSVQPYLMAAYNHAQAALKHAASWLVIEEPDRLTLALVDGGVWRAVRTRRKEANWRIALPGLLDRESALLGLEAPCTEVTVCGETGFEEETRGAYRMRGLALAPAGDEQTALALAMG